MKCRNCQKENPESAKICVFCGKPLYDTPPAFHPPKDEEEVVLKKEEQPSPAPQPKRSKTPMIVAIVLGALIVLGLAFAVIFGLRYSQQMDQKDEQIQDLLEENDQAWESLQEEREARQDAEEKAQEEAHKLDEHKPEIESIKKVNKIITLPSGKNAYASVAIVYYKPLEINDPNVARIFIENHQNQKE